MHTREQLVQQLKQSTLEVTFTKVNGEQRVMTCTLKESALPTVPTAPENAQVAPRKSSETSIAVWDLTASAWRSFRVDSVTNVTDLG
jgi:hypothetical protein